MFGFMRHTCLLLLIGYLCLFMLLPSQVSGALLKSELSPSLSSSPDNAWQIVVDRLMELGMNREDAERKTALMRESGITFNQDFIFAGGEPPTDYDPPINEIGYIVVIFLGIGVAAGIIALMSSNSRSNN